MEAWSYGRSAFGIALAAVFLAGCGASVSPSPQHAPNYAVVLSFNGDNGTHPAAGLTLATGVNPLVLHSGPFYGTTQGSLAARGADANGFGTVFSLTTNGAVQVLHRFSNAAPKAGVVEVNSALYGTTWNGGSYGAGTVFIKGLTTDAAHHCNPVFKFLHSFGGNFDGAHPFAGLTELHHTLYGTTANGGAFGYGTVFGIRIIRLPGKSVPNCLSFHEYVLYSFGQPSANPYDGYPEAGLTVLNGILYGTSLYSKGAVYSVTTTGKESVLYLFKGGADGAFPKATLTVLNGALYGTTVRGGNQNNGTVFSITTSGNERVVYAFKSGADGASPQAGLTVLNGALYGTTSLGGANGFGTVFSVTTDGTEKVLHSFMGGSDGANPEASLTVLGDTLFGTTFNGGANNVGTVFALTP